MRADANVLVALDSSLGEVGDYFDGWRINEARTGDCRASATKIIVKSSIDDFGNAASFDARIQGKIVIRSCNSYLWVEEGLDGVYPKASRHARGCPGLC